MAPSHKKIIITPEKIALFWSRVNKLGSYPAKYTKVRTQCWVWIGGCRNLFVGTDGDNMMDKVRKGRARGGSMPGTTHVNSKLTEGNVIVIRKLYAEGDITQKKLGVMFGVSKHTVWVVLNGLGWTHV